MARPDLQRLRLVRPFSKPFWTSAVAQPGHRIPEPGGSGRTRKDTKQTAIKYERTLEEPRGTGGHVTNTVRDREAPGSNPGAPDQFCIQNRHSDVLSKAA